MASSSQAPPRPPDNNEQSEVRVADEGTLSGDPSSTGAGEPAPPTRQEEQPSPPSVRLRALTPPVTQFHSVPEGSGGSGGSCLIVVLEVLLRPEVAAAPACQAQRAGGEQQVSRRLLHLFCDGGIQILLGAHYPSAPPHTPH